MTFEDEPFEEMAHMVSTRKDDIIKSEKYRVNGDFTINATFKINLFELICAERVTWGKFTTRFDDLADCVNEFIGMFIDDDLEGWSMPPKGVKVEPFFPEYDWNPTNFSFVDLATDLRAEGLWTHE